MPPTTTYKLISADGHFNEPGDLWTSRVESKFLDQVPRIESFEQGDAWVMEAAPAPKTFGWGSSAGRPPAEHGEWCRFEDLNKGSYEPSARVAEMEADGIDAEVLFPSGIHQWITAAPSDDLHLALVRAYNDWVSQFCSYDPSRLGGVAMLPSRGVDSTVAELERILTLPGFKALMLKCYPNGTLFIEPEDDAVWARVQESGLPLTIHVALGNTMPEKLRAQGLPGTVHFNDAPQRILQFIFSGVLDRFPDLIIPMTETDCGWLPYFSEQADDNYLRHKDSSLRDHRLPMLPSEYMLKHFPATFINDAYAIANRHRIGVERMMWSNDYPHITSDWPYSWKSIKAAFADVPGDEKAKIICGNAQRIYKFGQ
ncbi:MAG TPA: amidohydrolase family protein [Ilumatobacter sp.]|nr:amidohydrolase family protein [Ilumatobacter sp.]